MKLFNRYKTKWILLGNYQFGYVDYVVFVRGDKKTGLMDFKVKKVHKWTFGSNENILNRGLVDVKKQWEIITDMLK